MEFSLLQILIIVVVGGAFLFWLVYKGVKAQKCTKKYSDNNFAGEIGEALIDMQKKQKGKVFIHGEIWKAVAMSEIQKGDEVIAVDVKKFIVYVKKYGGD